MCGRTSLAIPQAVLEDRFGATAVRAIPQRYNIAPGDDLAVIQNDAPAEIDLLEWGLLPSWVDDPDDWPMPINARAETVAERNSFRAAFESRRCLVLADGFYDWRGERGHKQPYRVTRADGEPFAFAGLWESWGGNGDARETVAIVTTDANDAVAAIHDRMPVMLAPEEEATWRGDAPPDELHGLLDPFPAEETRTYPVSTLVNDPGTDRPAVTEPIDIGEQSGLGEFT